MDGRPGQDNVPETRPGNQARIPNKESADCVFTCREKWHDGRSVAFGQEVEMPGKFDERDRGYEAKWAHDAEMHFKVLARRNDLLGHWAAGEFGLSPSDADTYAERLIKLGVTGEGTDSVFEKIRDDFAARNISLSEHAIHRRMEELFSAAASEMIHRDQA
jgi:hypothetical protein